MLVLVEWFFPIKVPYEKSVVNCRESTPGVNS